MEKSVPRSPILDNPVFNCIANSARDVYVFVNDMKTGISHWSPDCIYYFDLPDEYMDNVDQIWIKKIHPDDRHLFLDDIRDVFSGKSDVHRVQYRAMNRYGQYVWLECNGRVYHDESGQAAVFAGLMQRIDNYTKYDPLTKLLTPQVMDPDVYLSGRGSMLLISLDHFRAITSTYGTDFANRVLVTVANDLLRLCGPDDTLYRFGGHEFLFDLKGGSIDYAGRLFGRIAGILEHVRHFGEHALRLTASGGITVYPDHSNRLEDLTSFLEHSLQHAKDSSRGRAIVYTSSLSNRHVESMKLRAALSESIENSFEGFELYYQPILNLRSLPRMSCECLLRWKYNGEIISPTRFIPLLENSGEILQVGEWVMRQALQTVKDWEDRDLPYHLAFNTSPLQYLDTRFAHQMVQYGAQLGVDASRISVELTESYGVNDFEALNQSVELMRYYGYRVSMDDFGMAYSTMSLLRELHVDSIKIDHTFVFGLRKQDSEVDHAMIQSIIDMSHRIGLKVVGEGIEDSSLKEKLMDMGVDCLQGYLYSRPVPKDEFEKIAPEITRQFNEEHRIELYGSLV